MKIMSNELGQIFPERPSPSFLGLPGVSKQDGPLQALLVSVRGAPVAPECSSLRGARTSHPGENLSKCFRIVTRQMMGPVAPSSVVFERYQAEILDKYERAGRMTSLWDVFQRVYIPVKQTEQMLLKMTHFYTMINQIVFFTLCDRAIGSDQKINSVYSLMLYNVIAYCLHYVKDIIKKEDWSPYVNVSQHSNVRHLAMSATKIVLEWTKAVTVIITVVFLVLAFSAKEGLDNYQPTLLYTIFTLLHYVATEKTFLEMFPEVLSRLQLDAFESLETLWAPVILKAYTITISALFALVQVLFKNYRLAICGIYINVILCWKDADRSCFQQLKRELEILGQFRDATLKQISVFDDICSVCLSPMKTAKVTPCQHLFHADCLRQCLKNRTDCPICKRELRYNYY